MSKRVLIFSTAYLPFIGGAEVAVKELTDRLIDYDFDLITAKLDPKLKSEEQVGRVKVYRLGWGVPMIDKLFLPFLGAFKAVSLDQDNHYTLFWCVMATFASGVAYIHNLFRFWHKIPIILNLQEGDSESHLTFRWFGLIGLSWGLALKRTTYLTVISNYLATRAKKYGYRGSVSILPNGVDLKMFFCDQTKFNSQNEKIIFTASRLVKKNAVGVIIQALAKLPTNFNLRIAGTGEEEVKLKTLVKNLNLESRVKFLGNIANDQIPQELQQADVFTRPSRSEGLGNSFLEAMAAGVPVIATAVGGITDFLKDNETGFIVPVDDAESLAEKINWVTDEKNKAKVWEIANNARELIKQNYDWDKIALRMSQIFASLI